MEQDQLCQDESQQKHFWAPGAQQWARANVWSQLMLPSSIYGGTRAMSIYTLCDIKSKFTLALNSHFLDLIMAADWQHHLY